MPARAFLIRLLLSMALVLNGTVPAMAAVRMQVPAGDAGQSSRTQAHAPCHAMASGAMEQAPAMPQPAKSPQKAPDCCKGGSCTCACVQPAQAPPSAAMAPTAAAAPSPAIRPLALGHASPALPHPIRPPIG